MKRLMKIVGEKEGRQTRGEIMEVAAETREDQGQVRVAAAAHGGRRRRRNKEKNGGRTRGREK